MTKYFWVTVSRNCLLPILCKICGRAEALAPVHNSDPVVSRTMLPFATRPRGPQTRQKLRAKEVKQLHLIEAAELPQDTKLSILVPKQLKGTDGIFDSVWCRFVLFTA